MSTATPDWSRDDVTKALVEKLGFTPDPNAPGIMFLRGENLRMSIVDGHGTMQLAHDNPLWAVNFTSSVPASVILNTVGRAAAEDDYVFCLNCALRIAKVPPSQIRGGSPNTIIWFHVDTHSTACSVGDTLAEPAPKEG
jgi:hypothetical protein